MKRAVDLNPCQFRRHERALGARFIKQQLRKVEPLAAVQPEVLTIDFAHTTDAANFLLALLGCPPDLRSFIDALIGISGYRAGKIEWFSASDGEISRRVDRSAKWVQQKRKQLLAWQFKFNFALVDIEDNKYKDGEKRPHRYRVHIAGIAAETMLDARQSDNWKKYKFSEAMKESAKTMLDSLPEFPIHMRHGGLRRADPETTMERELKAAVTKVRKAKQINEQTGNRIVVNDKMRDSINQLRKLLDHIEP